MSHSQTLAFHPFIIPDSPHRPGSRLPRSEADWTESIQEMLIDQVSYICEIWPGDGESPGSPRGHGSLLVTHALTSGPGLAGFVDFSPRLDHPPVGL